MDPLELVQVLRRFLLGWLGWVSWLLIAWEALLGVLVLPREVDVDVLLVEVLAEMIILAEIIDFRVDNFSLIYFAVTLNFLLHSCIRLCHRWHEASLRLHHRDHLIVDVSWVLVWQILRKFCKQSRLRRLLFLQGFEIGEWVVGPT